MARKGFARYWLAAALAVSAAPAAQAANFFDEFARAFFGAPRAVGATPIYEPEVVRQRPVAPRPRAEASSKPKPPAVQLDPANNQQWYLKDPTLRRGDIVVTAGGVMVYQGRDADMLRQADFTALGGKDPGGWKQRLEAAAAGGRSFFRDAPPRPSSIALEGTDTAQASTRSQ